MKIFDTLDEKNFLLYAAKHYYKPNILNAEEFYEDLKRFMYLKRLFKRYNNNGELTERLILNHLIVIFNVFGIKPALKMLEYEIDQKYWYILKPFLIYLRYIRNDQYTNIQMSKEVINKLRKV
jgi:hypothetical protein